MQANLSHESLGPCIAIRILQSSAKLRSNAPSKLFLAVDMRNSLGFALSQASVSEGKLAVDSILADAFFNLRFNPEKRGQGSHNMLQCTAPVDANPASIDALS